MSSESQLPSCACGHSASSHLTFREKLRECEECPCLEHHEPELPDLGYTSTWDELPRADQGKGICDWCQRAITDEWPAVQYPDGDNAVTHFHICPFIEKESI